MRLIDSHAHLDFSRFNKDRNKVIERAFTGGIEYIVNIGADLKSSQNSIELSREYDKIYATVGVHPHDADMVDLSLLKKLNKMAQNSKVVAIGETGLDYYYDNSPRQEQRRAFRAQLRIAADLKLPVVIHSREAFDETLNILKEEKADDIDYVLHCFAGDKSTAKKAIKMGLYLSFGGLITFRNLHNLREVAKDVPLDKILIETDSPYLTPEPYRGKRNEPLYVKYVAQKLAEVKGITAEKVAEVTSNNAKEFYEIPL
ncbi:MAG: TatD family hydrolase [Halanaerobiales bacterium]